MGETTCATCEHHAKDGYCDFPLPTLPRWLDDLWRSPNKMVTASDGDDCATYGEKPSCGGTGDCNECDADCPDTATPTAAEPESSCKVV